MRAPYIIVLLVLLGADPAPPQVGTITGSVAAVKGEKVQSRDDVYVYLEPVPKPKKTNAGPGDKLTRQIVQTGKSVDKPVFDPKVMVIPRGTTVWFPNLQRQKHNVFSPTDPIFNLGRYTLDKKGKSQKLDLAGELDIYCDVHPTMWAKVKVVDTIHIARVVDGKFSIPNVPPGRYKVVAWVRDSAEVKSSVVTVTAGKSVAIDRALHLQVTTRSGCHLQSDGTPYDDTKYGPPCPEDY